MKPLGSDSGWSRSAFAFLFLTLSLLALEVWAISSSLAFLLG